MRFRSNERYAIPSDGHVTLAWGRDYGDVTPVKGIALGGGQHTVEVQVRVVPAADREAGARSVSEASRIDVHTPCM